MFVCIKCVHLGDCKWQTTRYSAITEIVQCVRFLFQLQLPVLNMKLWLVACLMFSTVLYTADGCCAPDQWEGNIGIIGEVARRSDAMIPELIAVIKNFSRFRLFLGHQKTDYFIMVFYEKIYFEAYTNILLC